MKKILVVDDDKKICDLMKSVLDKAGYEVTAAYSGREGLDAALNSRPDLIITDLIMDNMSGGMMTLKLREHANTSTIPIIYITGLFREDEAHFVRNYKILEKPFTADELIAVVNETFENNQS